MDKAVIETNAYALTNAEERLAINLAFASRMLSNGGHDDLNQGQVSARMPQSRRFLIKSATRGFNEAVPADMIPADVDPSGEVSPLAPPELPLHQAIYAARPDINAIVHSHAPYTLVFGATDWNLQPISHDGAYFTDRVRRFTETSNTVLEIETGRSIANTLQDAPAIFLQNHGSVVVGKSVREAAVLAQVLERACRIQLLAESAGARYHVSHATDVKAKQDYVYSTLSLKSYWEYCVRQVKQSSRETELW